MLVGLTYDLRKDYLAMGYGEEETAEFDREDTIEGLEEALRRHGCRTDRIGHARRLTERLVAGERWDLVFNICEGLHGVGREAQAPAILDLYQVPYVFSDTLVLSLCLHKGLTKRVVRDGGVPTSDFRVVSGPDDLRDLRFDGPFFVKPVAEGTGKGCSPRSIVRERAALAGVCAELTARFGQAALVEPYLEGREFTTGIVGTGRGARAIATMEVRLLAEAEAGGYSYANKSRYEDRVAYRLSDTRGDAVAAAAERVALDAWRLLGARDAGRVDVRCDGRQQPQFMEVNPLAGLNPVHSDLPILARLAGIDFTTLIGMILREAQGRLGGGA